MNMMIALNPGVVNIQNIPRTTGTQDTQVPDIHSHLVQDTQAVNIRLVDIQVVHTQSADILLADIPAVGMPNIPAEVDILPVDTLNILQIERDIPVEDNIPAVQLGILAEDNPDIRDSCCIVD